MLPYLYVIPTQIVQCLLRGQKVEAIMALDPKIDRATAVFFKFDTQHKALATG